MRRILFPVVPLLLGAVALTGCGSDGSAAGDDPAPAASSRTTSTPPSAEPSVVPSADPTVEDVAATPTFPADVTAPVQGGHYVAVVLAVGEQADLDAAAASVAEYGYDAVVSDAGCIDGIAERLDLDDPTALVSSLLFEDARTARQFANAYIAAEDGLMVGRGPVTTYCLD